MICGQLMWQTEHPALLVWVNEGLGFYFGKKPINAKNVHLDLHISTLMMYSKLTTKSNMQKLHLHNVFKRCRLEREILANKLMLARLAPTTAAHLITGEPGYIGKIGGETLFLMNCEPVIVKLRKSDRCYEQLPILYKNFSHPLMEPISRVISTHGVEIKCNPLIAPTFRVDEKWIQCTPQVHAVEEPKRLAPYEDVALNFDSLENFSQHGIYNADEIQSLYRSFHFPQEREAIANMLAMRVAGYNISMPGYYPANIFSAEQFHQLAEFFFGKVWNIFFDFGMFSSGCIGAYLVFRIVKYFIGILLNAMALYRAMGPNPVLAASVWTTLTNLILHRQQMRRAAPRVDDLPELEAVPPPEQRPIETEKVYISIAPQQQVAAPATYVYTPM